ncbi:MAG: hypothetical protein U0894_10985 [Pirellulales bacterium]
MTTSSKPLSDCHGEHEFTLVLSGTAALTSEQEDSLFEAGCDDATIGLRNGRIYMIFSREAKDLASAIISAIDDINKAKIGLEVLRVDYCDLVTIADIAKRTDRTRQCIHQYITGARGPKGFPPPECSISDDQSLWRWCDVANWLLANQMITPCEQKDANFVQILNDALSFARQKRENPELVAAVSRCVPCGQ